MCPSHLVPRPRLGERTPSTEILETGESGFSIGLDFTSTQGPDYVYNTIVGGLSIFDDSRHPLC